MMPSYAAPPKLEHYYEKFYKHIAPLALQNKRIRQRHPKLPQSKGSVIPTQYANRICEFPKKFENFVTQ